MRRSVLLASLAWLSLTTAVGAKECKGIDFPEHVQVDGTDLTLNGLGIRKATFLKVSVYVAGLYVTQPSHDPQTLVDPTAPAELILQFVRNVGVSDLKSAWSEGFDKVAQDQASTLTARVATLNSWMTDMKTGQRMAFIRKPDKGIQVSVNGAVKGTITGNDFSRALLSIWLGASPPNSELKSGLLGGECD